VLGSEAHGVPDAVVALLDTVVRIPMSGASESLNVAVAASVLMFEAARQRRGESRSLS
jgi:TrmH family RNA methyltransferase